MFIVPLEEGSYEKMLKVLISAIEAPPICTFFLYFSPLSIDSSLGKGRNLNKGEDIEKSVTIMLNVVALL